MTAQAMDQSKYAAFGEKMTAIVNSAGLALMMSVGHQTGLFDTMAGLPPSTIEQIATAGKLNARYVREWLGVMVSGGIIEYDPGQGCYVLPAENAAWLTRAAGLKNIARTAQFVALLGSVEQGIVESFQKGGGVPYSEYSRFQKLMAERSRDNTQANLLDTTLPLVPGIVERLKDGIDVADIGCGQGYAIILMAEAFPKSQFTGYDFSAEGIAVATTDARRLGLANVHFEVKDVSTLDGNSQFDFITAFDAIHDQAHPAKVLQGIANALRPGGIFLMVDMAASSKLEENLSKPFATWSYTISCMHCMTVSLALGGDGLGAMWGKQKAQQMLAEAGFVQVEVKEIQADPFNYYYIASKG